MKTFHLNHVKVSGAFVSPDCYSKMYEVKFFELQDHHKLLIVIATELQIELFVICKELDAILFLQ